MLHTFLSVVVGLTLVGGVVVLWLFYHAQKNYKLVSHLPGPLANPIIGNIPQLRKLQEEDQVPIWLTWAKQYGTVFRISAPFAPPAVFISDPEDIMHVLKKKFDNYPKGQDLTVIFQDLVGNGIFNTNGPSWFEQRKTASHIFKVKTLRYYFDVFLKHANEFAEILDRNASSGEPFDIQQLLYCYTFDSICAIAFGHAPRTLRDGSSEFLRAFDTAQKMVEVRGRSPLFHFHRYTSPADRAALAFCDQQCYQIIRQRQERIASGEPFDEQDLLSLYMRDPSHDIVYLRDMILNFMLAGRDTTASTLTWAIYLISKHPHVEQRLLEELSAHGISSQEGQLPQFELMKGKDLPYLRNVLDETLRLYPPVPYDPKSAIADDTLPSGFLIKAGTTVVWSAFVTGRLEQFWENPDTFDPDRWSPANLHKIHPLFKPFDFPFQWGPRACLGRDLARLEVSTLLAMVLPRFKFEPLVEALPGKSITLIALNGISLRVSKR